MKTHVTSNHNASVIPFDAFLNPFFSAMSFSPDDNGGVSDGNGSDSGQKSTEDGKGTADKSNSDSKKGGSDERARERHIRYEGERRANAKWANELAAIGVDVVKDEDGEIDVDATRAKLREHFSGDAPKPKSKPKGKSGAKGDDEEEDEREKLIREANERAEKAEQRANAIAVSAAIERAIPDNLFSSEDCLNRFEKTYRAELHNGEVRLYMKDGTRARNAKGELMTIKEAMVALVAANPHWIKAEHRGDGRQSGHIGGTANQDTSTMTNAQKFEYAKEQRKTLGRHL
jgi:hypothetical protein